MQTTGTSARRLIAIAGFMFAVVFGAWCLLWYASAGVSLSNTEGAYQFLGVGFVALGSGVAALLTARSRWRWPLLVLLLPISFVFCERAWNLWSWSQRTGIFPYFLFLIPSALVAFALSAFARWLTEAWDPATRPLSSQNIVRASLHAFPFALSFAPMWFVRDDLSFAIPASAFLFIPGFGGIFGRMPTDLRGIIIATTSLFSLWVVLTVFFLRRRPRTLKRETKHDDEA